jgi:hypothetical protein
MTSDRRTLQSHRRKGSMVWTHVRRAGRSIAFPLPGIGIILLFLTTAFSPTAQAADPPPANQEPRPLMRFPDIHEDTIVFVHGEDIWTVPAGGGINRHAADHPRR